MAEQAHKRLSLVVPLTLGSVVVCLALLLTLLSYNGFKSHSQEYLTTATQVLESQERDFNIDRITGLARLAAVALSDSSSELSSISKLPSSTKTSFSAVLAQLRQERSVRQVYIVDRNLHIILPEQYLRHRVNQYLQGAYPEFSIDDNNTETGHYYSQDEKSLIVVQVLRGLNSAQAALVIEMDLPVLSPLSSLSPVPLLSPQSPISSSSVVGPIELAEASLNWWLLSIIFFMCLSAVAYFAWVLSRSELNSLASLRRYTSALAAGDYSTTLKLNENDPLSDIASLLKSIGQLLHEQQRRLIRLSYRDSLTGLANRHQFFKWLSDELENNKHSGKPFALLIIDLDQFKRVNDSLGHEVGDEILLEVAGRLRQVITSFHYDCADDDLAYLARFSGDEFGILLPQIDGGRDAILLAQRIQAAMLEPLHNGEHVLHLGASIGICLCPEDGKTPALLLKNAEVAMYQAKAAGPNNFQMFAEFMSLTAIKRLNVEVELQRAIENQELRLFYQPKFDVRRRQMVGSEALLRWQHPQRGLLGPEYFLDVAEQTALIGQIGRWVTQEVCRQLSEWQGSEMGRLPVALNISAAEFQLRDVVGDLRDSLRRYELDAGLLQMEVTETTIASQEDKVGRDLAAIRRLGVKVWIDDFGTGYSSLGYLRRFSVDGVKIDRSFVHEVAHNPADAALCSAIVAMASQLDLDVVAEGVEEREQFDLLLNAGCSQAQGFFYARPMSPDVLSKQAGQLLQVHSNVAFS